MASSWLHFSISYSEVVLSAFTILLPSRKSIVEYGVNEQHHVLLPVVASLPEDVYRSIQ